MVQNKLQPCHEVTQIYLFFFFCNSDCSYNHGCLSVSNFNHTSKSILPHLRTPSLAWTVIAFPPALLYTVTPGSYHVANNVRCVTCENTSLVHLLYADRYLRPFALYWQISSAICLKLTDLFRHLLYTDRSLRPFALNWQISSAICFILTDLFGHLLYTDRSLPPFALYWQISSAICFIRISSCFQ
jgi:hypothetical protein